MFKKLFIKPSKRIEDENKKKFFYDDDDDDDEDEDIEDKNDSINKHNQNRSSYSSEIDYFKNHNDMKNPKFAQHNFQISRRTSIITGNRLDRKVLGSIVDAKIELPSDSSSITEPTPSNTEHIAKKFGQKFIILHYSPFKAVWDWIVLLLVLYTAIVTPYTAAFLLNEDEKRAKLNQQAATRLLNDERMAVHPLIILDLIVDVMFLVDILLSFRTTCVSKEGEIITDSMCIAKNYLKGWFFIDAIAAMPYDLLIFGSGNIDTLKITGLLKIIRLFRLARLFKKLEQYSEYGSAILLSLMAVFVIAGHWLACVFYAIAYIERPLLPDPKYTWLDHLAEKYNMPFNDDEVYSGPDMSSKYLTALFFTMTSLTSVGFGNVAPTTNGEKVFSILAMLLGSLLSAAIFGNVTTIMMKMYQGTEELKEMRSSVSDFIKFHQMPKGLSKRMQESFEHTWTFTNGIDMNTVLKSFPESLQADICLHLNRQLLHRCPAFEDANAGCLRLLALQFKSTHVPPGDTLIHKGDTLDAIYFIARGTLEIVKDDVVMAILDKNDIFGENLSKYAANDIIGRSSCDVRALVYCDLHKIERIDLIDILDIYPEFAESFKKKFQVTFDLRECSLNEKSTNKRRLTINKSTSDVDGTQINALTGLLSMAKASNLLISPLFLTPKKQNNQDDKENISIDNQNDNKNKNKLFQDNSNCRISKNVLPEKIDHLHMKSNITDINTTIKPSRISTKVICDLQDIDNELENLLARTNKIEETFNNQIEHLKDFILKNVIKK